MEVPPTCPEHNLPTLLRKHVETYCLKLPGLLNLKKHSGVPAEICRAEESFRSWAQQEQHPQLPAGASPKLCKNGHSPSCMVGRHSRPWKTPFRLVLHFRSCRFLTDFSLSFPSASAWSYPCVLTTLLHDSWDPSARSRAVS